MAYIYRIGLDPEVAIVNKKTGLAASAHRFIKEKEVYTFYTDGDTAKTYGMKGSEVERDGAAIEVRSIVPSACRDNIIPYVAEALRQTHLKLKKWNKGQYVLSSAPVYELDATSLRNPPEDVLEFGCRPDFYAYSLEVKDPVLPEGDTLRYTGGHIHASSMGAAKNMEEQAALAILFDYFVAMPFVGILGERFAAGEAERRQFYGQPGSFRYDNKLDKIEFRTLSGRLLLHPTLMYWVLGAMKMFVAGVPAGGYKSFLKKISTQIKPADIHEVIMNHDVAGAEELGRRVFKLLPTYREDKNSLANPMSGGGAGTKNPYFYEKAFEVFVTGNHQGIGWDDDMVINWGLYDNYEPKHHAYWGIQQAMVGLCDDTIFPYNAVLPEVWDTSVLNETPIYTHPLNGGAKQYVTPGAVGWLQ